MTRGRCKPISDIATFSILCGTRRCRQRASKTSGGSDTHTSGRASLASKECFGRSNSPLKHRREVSAPPTSPQSWRLTIQLPLSLLTVARGALVCRSISFLPSAAARPSSRVGERSSNPVQRCSRQFSNALACRRGRSWPFGDGDGFRKVARKSERPIGGGYPRIQLPSHGLFHRATLCSSDTDGARYSFSRHARLHAW
jgi:hypothetical protein